MMSRSLLSKFKEGETVQHNRTLQLYSVVRVTTVYDKPDILNRADVAGKDLELVTELLKTCRFTCRF